MVAGADLRYVDSVLPIITTLLPLRCASACAFTTTERALHGFTITSEDLSGVVNALTCYGLRFVELTAGDQAAPIETYLSDVLMLAFFSPGWIRTSDLPLRRRLLFPLSYRQIWQ